MNKKKLNSQSSKIITNNILVAVRVRPLNEKEKLISKFETIKVLDNKQISLIDPQYELAPDDYFRANRNREKQYTFDLAFDNICTQVFIFEKTTKFLIDNLFKGYNSTVFAYGATGAGKTHTMIGYNEHPGIMPLTLIELFKYAEDLKSKEDLIIDIKISFLEVYNEVLRDLLSNEDENLEIREDSYQGIIINGLNKITVSSKAEIMTILKIGNKNRTKEPTEANEVSSRSHAVFTLYVETRNKKNSKTKFAKLSLIDLAGSERAAFTNNKGIRMVEGANINKSLLALGNCINALSDRSEKNKIGNFIPYRNSKLTRLLKDSLGGNCRTVMIANISPSIINYEDTLNTLKYANRAKNIKTYQNKNNSIKKDNSDNINYSTKLEEYNEIINNLKKENNNLKQQLKQSELDLLSNPNNDIQERDKIFINLNEKLIINHFHDEKNLNLKIYSLEDEIEKYNNENFNNINNNDIYICQLKEDLIKLNHENTNLLEKRNNLQNIWNNVEKESFSYNYLSTLISKEIVKIDNLLIKRNENKELNQNKNKSKFINQIKNEIKIKDNILLEQRLLLQKNKIYDNFDYDNLKSINYNPKLPKIDNVKFKVNNNLYNHKKRSYLPTINWLKKKTEGHSHKLPLYLRERIKNSSKQKLILKSNKGDNNLSYNRKLQKAIHLQKGGKKSNSKTPSYSKKYRYNHIKKNNKIIDINKLKKELAIKREKYKTPEALQLLKKKYNNKIF